ncbi:MAG TPA: IS21 family transposase, partial [Thermoleophilia bacterium]|nr:IS21 family transposase [Thermoleophilia bacterium]
MIGVEAIEVIRRAYFIEGMSIRQISRRCGHCRRTVRKAIQHAGPTRYGLGGPRPAPVLAVFKDRIEQLVRES